MKFHRTILLDFLHIFVLVGFAVAQPLYDLIAQNPEFFVAHKASPALIVSVVAFLSFGLPLAFIFFELIGWIIGERGRRWVHWFLVWMLALLAFMPMVKQVGMSSDRITIAMATIIATLFIGLYAFLQPIRMFLNLLAPAIVIFPLWFLLFTPIKSLLITPLSGAETDIEIKNPVPVVVVVFDEFGLTPLLDAAGKIDRIRFPNFAEFADNSWWFSNAIAASITTRGALPGIVSGLQPPSPYELTPTANDFPHNLFTLLGNHYQFNVVESVTTLCPPSYCGQENKTTGLGGVTMIFSDLGVIYLHLISPPSIDQQLPPLDLQWAGFGVDWLGQALFKNQTNVSPLNDPHKAHLYRDVYLSRFLSQIEEPQKPTLHFLHVLLPHAPYEFLASGHKYLPSDGAGPAGLKNDNEGWIGKEPLILTAYHRYLQQIGYVDRFLGQLRHSLKTAHLYDNALIILTADHGVSFREGTSRRLIDKENARDILRIPLFVKLPGQGEGRISERLVSCLDIFPTIMHVLKVKSAWEIDGRSLFGNQDLSRKNIEIKGVGLFKAEELLGFARLNWQIDHFQEHSSLEKLVPKGPFPSLIGQTPSDIIFRKPSEMEVFHPDHSYLQNVNPQSGFLPALFWAHISGTNNQNMPVAVALNDRIWATTQTGKWKGNDNFFSVLLPPKAFKPGRNHVGIYLIDKMGKALIPIPLSDGRPNIRLLVNNSGRRTLLFPDGASIFVEADSKNLRGYIDRVTTPRKMLVFEGWAADIGASRPAASILIFAGEDLVTQVAPEIPRPDVGKVFHLKGLLNSGYRAAVPLDILKSLPSQVSVIAHFEDQKAVLLKFTDEQQKILSDVVKTIDN